jgi:hypothetical protein
MAARFSARMAAVAGRGSRVRVITDKLRYPGLPSELGPVPQKRLDFAQSAFSLSLKTLRDHRDHNNANR